MKRRDVLKLLAGVASIIPFVSLDAETPEPKPVVGVDTVPENLFKDNSYPVLDMTGGFYQFKTDASFDDWTEYTETRGMIVGITEDGQASLIRGTPFGVVEGYDGNGQAIIRRIEGAQDWVIPPQ